MKKMLVTLVAACAFISANAQLENTKWKATLQFDSPTEVYADFSTDTVHVYSSADNSLIETMTYTLEDSVLTLRKVEGQSSCDTSSTGTYDITVKDDTLTYSLEDDDCDDRASVLDESQWAKMP